MSQSWKSWKTFARVQPLEHSQVQKWTSFDTPFEGRWGPWGDLWCGESRLVIFEATISRKSGVEACQNHNTLKPLLHLLNPRVGPFAAPGLNPRLAQQNSVKRCCGMLVSLLFANVAPAFETETACWSCFYLLQAEFVQVLITHNSYSCISGPFCSQMFLPSLRVLATVFSWIVGMYASGHLTKGWGPNDLE